MQSLRTFVRRFVTSACLLAAGQVAFAASPGEQEKRAMYLVTHAGAGDPFWSVVFKGAKHAAQQLGLELSILSPERPNDIARQVQLLDAAIARRPAGIALTVPDNRAFVRSLQTAKKLGIPVVAFNSRPDQAHRAQNPYDAYIGMDEYQAGRKVAEVALESKRLKHRVVVAIHQPGHVGLESRYRGIAEVLKPAGLIVDKLDVGSDGARAQLIVKSYLKRHPDVSGIFTVGASGLHPIAKLLEEQSSSLYLASFDLSQMTLHYIQKGVAQLTLDQQPYMQAYMAVVQLNLMSRTRVSASDMDTGSGIVDQSNAGAIAKLVQDGLR